MLHTRVSRAVRLALLTTIVPLGTGLVASSPAMAQVKLDEKFPPGRVYKQKSAIRSQQVLTLNATPIETQSTRTVLSEISIGKAREDTSIPVTIAYQGFKVDLALPGVNVSYDSANPDANKIENPQLAFLKDLFGLMSQIRYTLIFDPPKKIKAVEGTEALVEKANKLGDPVKQSMQSVLTAESLKAQHQQGLGRLPDILVRPGESWERTEVMNIDGGQSLTFQKKYQYVGTEKKGEKTLDKIESKITQVTYSQDPAFPTPLKATKSDLVIDSSSGTFLFDREEGYIVHDKGSVRIKGGMTFAAGGQEIPAKLDLTLEHEVDTQPAPAAK